VNLQTCHKIISSDNTTDRACEDLRAGDYYSAVERMIYAVTGEFLDRSPSSFIKLPSQYLSVGKWFAKYFENFIFFIETKNATDESDFDASFKYLLVICALLALAFGLCLFYACYRRRDCIRCRNVSDWSGFCFLLSFFKLILQLILNKLDVSSTAGTKCD
jgi:hypothetical protein